jgi:hypothetical protein
VRRLSEAEERQILLALAPRLGRMAGARSAAAALAWTEVAEARGVSPHELWSAFADAFELERIEVVFGCREGAVYELDVEEVVAFGVEGHKGPVTIFTRDFKFLATGRPREGAFEATVGAPERFLGRVEEALPALVRRPV